MRSKAVLILCILFLSTCFKSNAQDYKTNINDSIKLDILIGGMEEFYSDPIKYKENLPKALKILNRLINNDSDNLELLKKKSDVMRYNFSFVRRSQSDDSISNYFNEYKILREKTGDSCNLAIIYRNLANIMSQKGNLKRAEESLIIGYDLAKSCNDYEEMYLIRMNQLHKHANKNKNNIIIQNEIIKELKVILKQAEVLKLQRCEAMVLGKIGYLYNYRKNYDSIGKYLKASEKKNLERKDFLRLRVTNRRLASYFKRGENNIPKALEYYHKSLSLCEALGDRVQLKLIYLGLSNTYDQIGDYKKSLFYYKKYTKIKVDLIDLKSYHKLIDLEEGFKYTRKRELDSLKFNQQKRILKIEIERNNYRNRLYLLSFLIFLICLLLAGVYFRKMYLKDKQLSSKLKKQVISKENEVTQLLTESLQLIKSKHNLANNLKKVAETNDTSTINSILADLKSESIDEKRLIFIKEHIEELNFEFFQEMKKRHPTLTKTDLEICSYMKLGFSKQEIAKLRFTNPESVKVARYRIRKKMKLTPDIDFEKYLNSFVIKS